MPAPDGTSVTQFYNLSPAKRPAYIFTFGEFNSQQGNVGGIQNFLSQFQTLKLRRKEMLNAANINLMGIKLTKCKYIDRSFVTLY